MRILDNYYKKTTDPEIESLFSYTMDLYEQNFIQTIAFLKTLPNGEIANYIGKSQSEYPCKHEPCCFACHYASSEQRKFEDKVAHMIGDLTVTAESIIVSESLNKEFTHIGERFKHLLLSPKYLVIVEEIIYNNQKRTQHLHIKWNEFLCQGRKFLEYENHYHRLKVNVHQNSSKLNLSRRKPSIRVRIGDNCKDTCNGFSYCTGVRDSIFHRGSVYLGDNNSDESSIRMMSPINDNISPQVTGFGPSNHHRRKSVLRTNPLPQEHFSTESLQRIRSHDTGYRMRKKQVTFDNSGFISRNSIQHDGEPIQDNISEDEEEPEELAPLRSIPTGYSIGGSRIQSSQL